FCEINNLIERRLPLVFIKTSLSTRDADESLAPLPQKREARRGPGSGVRPVRRLRLANRAEGGAELGEPRRLAQHPIDAWRYRVLRQKMVPPASEENDQRPW